MPRDYKSRARSRKQSKQRPPLAWFAAGFLVGAAGVALVWLKLAPTTSAKVTTVIEAQPCEPVTTQVEPRNPVVAQEQHEVPKQAPESPKSAPRFEYYSVLPEMEVVIPPEELGNPKARPTTPSAMPDLPGAAQPLATSSNGKAEYLLQLGSFRSTGDADRLKASMALIGIAARVEKVTIENKGTYYRVRSGPYKKQQAYALHQKLKHNRVDSMIVKTKG